MIGPTNLTEDRGAFFKKILNGAMARQLAVSLWLVRPPALAAPNECVCVGPGEGKSD
jgi:hypothetical protein